MKYMKVNNIKILYEGHYTRISSGLRRA